MSDTMMDTAAIDEWTRTYLDIREIEPPLPQQKIEKLTGPQKDGAVRLKEIAGLLNKSGKRLKAAQARRQRDEQGVVDLTELVRNQALDATIALTDKKNERIFDEVAKKAQRPYAGGMQDRSEMQKQSLADVEAMTGGLLDPLNFVLDAASFASLSKLSEIGEVGELLQMLGNMQSSCKDLREDIAQANGEERDISAEEAPLWNEVEKFALAGTAETVKFARGLLAGRDDTSRKPVAVQEIDSMLSSGFTAPTIKWDGKTEAMKAQHAEGVAMEQEMLSELQKMPEGEKQHKIDSMLAIPDDATKLFFDSMLDNEQTFVAEAEKFYVADGDKKKAASKVRARLAEIARMAKSVPPDPPPLSGEQMAAHSADAKAEALRMRKEFRPPQEEPAENAPMTDAKEVDGLLLVIAAARELADEWFGIAAQRDQGIAEFNALAERMAGEIREVVKTRSGNLPKQSQEALAGCARTFAAIALGKLDADLGALTSNLSSLVDSGTLEAEIGTQFERLLAIDKKFAVTSAQSIDAAWRKTFDLDSTLSPQVQQTMREKTQISISKSQGLKAFASRLEDFLMGSADTYRLASDAPLSVILGKEALKLSRERIAGKDARRTLGL